MLHRPASSRLLSNLLAHEKEYTKSLHGTLDVSQLALASLSAYASGLPSSFSSVYTNSNNTTTNASFSANGHHDTHANSTSPYGVPSPTTLTTPARATTAVAGALAGAQDALRVYARAVEEWCELLRVLKDLEDEVGNVVRDREILVDRLIKASKSKDSKRRSLLTPSPSTPSPNSSTTAFASQSLETLALSTTPAKLSAAQAELQACETHLAEREAELARMRRTVVLHGLKARCVAMRECAWKWDRMGRDAIVAIESLAGQPAEYGSDIPTSRPSSLTSSLAPSQSASQIAHAEYSSTGHSSTFSAPSNMFLAPPEARPEADIANEPTFNGDMPLPHLPQTHLSQAPPVPAHALAPAAPLAPIAVPPAHALTDENEQQYVPARRELLLQLQHERGDRAAHAPSPVQEEDDGDDELGGSSAEEESDGRVYEVHENAPFGTPGSKTTAQNHNNVDAGKEKRSPAAVAPPLPRASGSSVRLPLPLMRGHSSRRAMTDESAGHGASQPRLPPSISAPLPVFPSSLSAAQARKIDPYGNLVSGSTSHQGHRYTGAADDMSVDGSPGRQRKWSTFLSGLFHKRGRTMSMSAASPSAAAYERPSTSTSASASAGVGGAWKTRTDRNLKKMVDSSDEEDEQRTQRAGSSTLVSEPIIDYAALRRKSAIEAKTLPNPGVLDLFATPGGADKTQDRDRDNTSTKSSPAGKGKASTGGRKKLRKTADAMRKRNASAVDVSTTATRELDVSDVSSRAVKGGMRPSPPANVNAKNDTASNNGPAKGGVAIPAIPPHMRALQNNGNGNGSAIAGELSSGASVSRSNTLTSNTSSTRSGSGVGGASVSVISSSSGSPKRAASLDIPPSQSQSQMKSAKRGSGTWSDGGRVGGLGTSTSTGTRATPPRPSNAHTHMRTTSHGAPPPNRDKPQASLMSIVEGVTKQNRAGWSRTNPDSLLVDVKAPKAVGSASLGPNQEADFVQRPLRVSSSSSLDGHLPAASSAPSRAAGDASSNANGTANGGLVGRRRVLTSTAAQSVDLKRLSTISASSSEPSLLLKDTMPSTPTPTPGHGRAQVGTMAKAPMPLRSALRNCGRSNSPSYSSSASTPRSASPAAGPTTTPAPARAPKPSAGPSAPPQPLPNGVENDDDTASMTSAYETGREDFEQDSDGGGSLTENAPPTPPPRDRLPSPLFTAQALSLPNGLVSGTKPEGTQASSSSASGGTATPPSRRKSVRVSLQPTFSPTPPALYDDEESDHAPWGNNSRAGAHSVTASALAQQSSWRTRAERGEDVWEDSSDDNDDEYSRAKQMLHSASKKLEKAGHLVGLK